MNCANEIGLIDALKIIRDNYSNEKICEFSDIQMAEYNKLLEKFKKVNSISRDSPMHTNNIHNIKGKALEDLVSFLLLNSGCIFEVERNLRTKTNEIDQFVTLNSIGKVLLNNGIIDKNMDKIVCECKNYNSSISVTYVGKFCSLLLSTSIRVGIIFSYKGISGKGWKDASGLVKKFYLHKEKVEERYCIINFSIKEFESISKGNNLLAIIDEQLKALQCDTDYSSYLSKHPAENVEG